jgi:hypothetical protein
MRFFALIPFLENASEGLLLIRLDSSFAQTNDPASGKPFLIEWIQEINNVRLLERSTLCPLSPLWIRLS